MKFKRKNIKINQYMNIVQNVQKEADLYIAGDITDMEWWGDEVTPQLILDKLYEIAEGTSTLNIFINSYGGSVVAGNFIYDLLKDFGKKKDIFLDVKVANAYSMASGIAMVGDKVSMYANGIFMIHKPLASWVSGNSDDMRKEADVLDVFETSLVANYMTRFNQDEQVLRDLMKEETWLTADKALEYGFIDEVIDPLEISNSARGLTVLNTVFDKKEVVENMLKADEIFKQKQKENKGGEVHEMKFNKVLEEKYGITEEAFNAFDDASQLVEVINALNEVAITEAVEEAVKEATENVPAEEDTVSVVELNETLGITDDEEKITKEDIANLVVKARNITDEMEKGYANYSKLEKEHKELKSLVVDETMKSYVRAMGVGSEGFDDMKKALNSMGLNSIQNLKKGWDNKAVEEIKAGKTSVSPNLNSKNIENLKKENYNI